MKEKNMSVNELADILGISRQALSKQIQGKMLVETAQKIATALSVPIWQLFTSPSEVESKSTMIKCPHCGKMFELEFYPKSREQQPTSVSTL